MSLVRRDQLAANLAAVRARIEAACRTAGRDAGEVTLVAVTKTFPVEDVRLLAALGVRDIGENRAQEATQKRAEAGVDVRWHFVGQIQRNKARAVAAFADVVHAVDRAELVADLDRHAARLGRAPTVLVQVALADEDDPATAGRGGAAPVDALALADAIAASDTLRLGGVMAVAPLGVDPDAAFARLARFVAQLREQHPAATIVSAGMSGDLEAAVRHGATHVRIGTALLGHRASPVG